jgi:glutathione S-transferase
MDGSLHLVTIPISHYCEKARWALERAGLSYIEERHVQGLHRLYSRRRGGSGTVPVLVTPEGPIGESEQILEWIDRRLEPERRLFGEPGRERDRVRALSRHFDEVLGPCGRRLIYVRMFAQRELMLRYNNQGIPRWEDRALRAGLPLAKSFIRHALAIRPGVEEQDQVSVWAELDAVAALLSDGRRYLAGGRFTAADLTFAALCAPLILPSVYGVALPSLEELDVPTAELVGRAREHPAGRFAARLGEERRADVAGSASFTATAG